jgi:hypothetical protein
MLPAISRSTPLLICSTGADAIQLEIPKDVIDSYEANPTIKPQSSSGDMQKFSCQGKQREKPALVGD